MRLIHKLTLDVSERNMHRGITAKQGDVSSRFLEIAFTNRGDPFDLSDVTEVFISALRADGEAQSFLGEISNGRYILPLTGWMLAIDDRLICDVTLIGSGGERLTTTGFVIEVESAANTNIGGPVEGDEPSDLLTALVENIENKLSEAKASGEFKGEQGDTGNGIVGIEKTATEGLVDTYTVTYTDGTTSEFTLKNGKDATVLQAPGMSTQDVMSQRAVTEGLLSRSIINTASGSFVHIEDSANATLQSLTVYGKSEQNGTPDPDNPVPIVSPGDGGKLDIVATSRNIFGGTLLRDTFVSIGGATKNDANKTVSYYANTVSNKVLLTLVPGEYTLILHGGCTTNFYANLLFGGANVRFDTNGWAVITVESTSAVKLTGVWNAGATTLYYEDCGVFCGRVTLEQFEPYKSQTATLDRSEILPLCSIGDVRDELRVFADGSGEVIRATGKTVFNGNESWIYSPVNGVNRFYVSTANNKVNGNGLCNIAVYNRSLAQPGICYIDDNFNIYADFGSVEAFCAFLRAKFDAGNPVYVIYELDVPEVIPLTAAEVQAILALKTHRNVTNIAADGAEIDVTYVADPKTYIDNKFAELQALILEQ